MIEVRINADDFGNDENRTMAICESFECGLITQTTAMVNCEWFDRAMEIARDRGFLSRVGLHFNLTEGEPLSEEMRRCSFFCENGRFTARFHLSTKSRFVIPGDAQHAVACEAEAQIKRYIAGGGRMLHLDSHHHVHTDWAIARILLPIARRNGFKSARLSLTMGDSSGLVKRAYKSFFNGYIRRVLTSPVDAFATYDGFESRWMNLPDGARVEVMVHPLYRNGRLYDEERLMSEHEDFWFATRNKIMKVADYAD